MKLCECGCGRPVKQGRRFILNHHLKTHNKDQKFRTYISELQKKRFREKTHPFCEKRGKRFDPTHGYLKLNLENRDALSYLLGATLGDGSVMGYERNHSYSVRLRVSDREFADEFYSALQKIGLHPSLRKCELRKKNPKQKDRWNAMAYGKSFYFWFQNVVPEDFLGDDLGSQTKFLKGLFEAEGCFRAYMHFDKRRNKKYPNYAVEISNNDLTLILLSKKIIEKLGFHPHLHSRLNKSGSRGYRINLNRKEEIKEFLEKLNPCIPRKRWHEIGCS